MITCDKRGCNANAYSGRDGVQFCTEHAIGWAQSDLTPRQYADTED